MPTDAMEAVGHVRVIKTDKQTGEVVFDQVFKNQITDFARAQCAQMWAGMMINVPQMISVGTGTSASGPQPSDTALWNEISGTRKNVDYATTFLTYYTQYAVTYDQTAALAPLISTFADLLTEYTGTSAAGWTSSSVSYGTSGATVTGSGGGSISSQTVNGIDPDSTGPVTGQVTFKIPTASPTSDYIHLVQDSQNFYEFYINGNIFKIAKTVAGVHTILTSSSTQTFTAGASYTMTYSMDMNGVITVKLYSGVGTGGTLLGTITATDTSLPGPYQLVIGGDQNLVISGVQATYPDIDKTYSTPISEAGLYDYLGNLWSHVQLNGVTHDNTTTLSIQWQVLQKGN